MAYSWGALGGAIIGNLLLQIRGVRGLGLRFRPSLDLGFPGVRRVGKLVLPVLFGVSLPQATAIVNGMFVAGIEGAKSILEYGNRLMQLPLGVFGQAIGIAVLPTLSQQAAEQDDRAFRETLAFGVRLAFFLTVPASALLMVLAQPLITVVFQRGNFTAADTAEAVPGADVLCHRRGGMVGAGGGRASVLCAGGHLDAGARGDQRHAAAVRPAELSLPRLLPRPRNAHGPRGPALAASLAAASNVLILLFFAHRRFGGIHGRGILDRSRARWARASPSPPLPCRSLGCDDLVLPAGAGRALAQLLLGGLAGLIAFLLAAWLLRSAELRQAAGLLRRRPR